MPGPMLACCPVQRTKDIQQQASQMSSAPQRTSNTSSGATSGRAAPHQGGLDDDLAYLLLGESSGLFDDNEIVAARQSSHYGK